MLVCVKEHNPRNIGDRIANPFSYFPYEHVAMTPVHDSVEQLLTMQRNGAHVIIGGGGLLYDDWLPWLRQLFERRSNDVRAGKLIVWGAGLNSHKEQLRDYPGWLDRAELVGVRDWMPNRRWVGCPSCMDPAFDTRYETTREVVIYDHGNADELFSSSWLDVDGIPRMSNFHDGGLADVLAFLGSAEVVLTSSYHGAYWATLLGRRVIARPFSSKFRHFRHPPALCEDGDWRAALPEAVNYPDALEACRASNRDFASRVVELIGTPSLGNEPPTKPIVRSKRPRIQLVNDNLGIGDVVCLLGVAHSIKHALPNSVLHFVTTPNAMAWTQLDNVFDDVIGVPRRRDEPTCPALAEHKRLPRGGTYDAVVDLRCRAYAYEQGTKKYRLDVLTSTVEHDLGMRLELQLPAIAVPEQARRAARRHLVELVGTADRPIIGLQPLSLNVLRKMSAEQLRRLVDALTARGLSCCVFHHCADDIPQLPEVPVIVGSSPTELAGLVAACDGFISVDSGLFHLAAALAIPTVAAFGSTDGQLIGGRYPDCDWVTAGAEERRGLRCSGPCYMQTASGWSNDCKHVCTALQRIDPAMLVDRLVRLLAQKRARSRTAMRSVRPAMRSVCPVRRIQILREFGGIGDLVMALQVASSIRAAKPEAEIALFTYEKGIPWVQLPWSNGMRQAGRMRSIVDAIMQVEASGRRSINELPITHRYPYMATGGPYDALVDLFDDEAVLDGPVTRSRLSRWMAAASSALDEQLTLKPATVVAAATAVSRAAYWLATHFRPEQRGPLIALQPLSYWRRRSLQLPAFTVLVEKLRGRCAARLVLLHHVEDVACEWADRLGITAAIGLPPAVVTELLRRCEAVVAVDSGLLHIAGALSVPTVGMFGHTDGKLVCDGYPTCVPITAATAERAGLDCQFPCYGRATCGYDNAVCGDGCRALQRINMSQVADATLACMRISRGA